MWLLVIEVFVFLVFICTSSVPAYYLFATWSNTNNRPMLFVIYVMRVISLSILTSEVCEISYEDMDVSCVLTCLLFSLFQIDFWVNWWEINQKMPIWLNCTKNKLFRKVINIFASWFKDKSYGKIYFCWLIYLELQVLILKTIKYNMDVSVIYKLLIYQVVIKWCSSCN